MRLTVRTLLAYLDHVLPEDANEALAAKLRESAYATQLAERIQDSIKRNDLQAPSVSAMHPIENANTIAEYLDNVLQAEHIPEVERVLLESDVHLSEAAACHQILTLVLSRPALVPSELRAKMYQLSKSLSGRQGSDDVGLGDEPLENASIASLDLPVTDIAALGAAVSAPTDLASNPAVPFQQAANRDGSVDHASASRRNPAASNTAAPKHRVPEYLRAGRPARILPWLMTLALCAVLLLVISKAFQPVSRLASEDDRVYSPSDPLELYENEQPAKQFGPVGEEPGVVVVQEGNRPAPPKESTSTNNDPKRSPAGAAASQVPASSESPEDAGSEPKVKPDAGPAMPTDSTPKPVVEPAVAESIPESTPATITETTTPAAVPGDMKPEGSAAKPVVEEVATESGNAGSTEQPSPKPMSEVASADKSDAGDKPDADSPETPTTPPVVEAQPTAEPKPVKKGAQIGTLASADALLIERQTDKFNRVGFEQSIHTGVEYVTLPTFRSTIALNNELQLTCVGPAEFSFEESDDAQPAIRLLYGRFLLEAAEASTSINLRVGDRQALIGLSDPQSQAAMEVTAYRPLGADPENPVSVQPVVAIQALSGSVDWAIDGVDQVAIAAPVRWSQVGTEAPVSDLADPRGWMKAPPANEVTVESIARKGLLELNDETKTVKSFLVDAVGYRRAEVAALAARSLMLLGISDVFFGAKGIFDNEAQKSHWTDHFHALRSQVDRGGKHAQQIRASIARMNAAEATQMYRLLLGYSPEQLKAGADFALVEALNDASLAMRVLALENLREITGTTLNYRPQETAPRRAAAAKKWDTKLAAKDIAWEEPPTPLSVLER
ncbi:MAG: hypothetical protein R3C05_26460 [Pirellulaceae bacterium]